RRVVVGDEPDTGEKGLEALMVLLLSRGGEGRERPAVKRPGGGEDLVAPALLAAPPPGELHRRLVRLGAAVAEEDALGKRMAAEEPSELGRWRRVVDVGGVEQLRGLRPDCVDDGRMAVAEVVDGEAGEEVEVALAVGVPQLGAAAAHEGDGLPGVDA